MRIRFHNQIKRLGLNRTTHYDGTPSTKKMKTYKQILLCTCSLALPFVTGCQKVQTASAEQLATQFGTGPAPLAAPGAPLAGSVPGTTPATATAPTTTPAPNLPAASQTGRNRFGFAGAESEAPVKPLRRDVGNHVPEVASAPKVDAPKIQAPKMEEPKVEAPKLPATPPANTQVVKLDFANAVPGDKLHVTLPGEYASVGPISVEKVDPSGNGLGSPWARGTQMQVPNPNVPGGKIYFKVP